MPCRDYESDGYDYHAESVKMKQQADKLARIACKAMTVLEENGIEDFLLLQDDEVRTWWAQHKEADRKEKARVAEIERKERVKAEALARLSDEEKELLGLAKPKKHKKAKTVTYDVEAWDMDKEMEELESKLEEAMDIATYSKTYNKMRWNGD